MSHLILLTNKIKKMSIRSYLRKTKKITKINTPITLLVTGQSGIAIETSLKKFFIYIDNLYEQAGIPAKYEIFHYSIEDEIKLVFQEEIKKELIPRTTKLKNGGILHFYDYKVKF